MKKIILSFKDNFKEINIEANDIVAINRYEDTESVTGYKARTVIHYGNGQYIATIYNSYEEYEKQFKLWKDRSHRFGALKLFPAKDNTKIRRDEVIIITSIVATILFGIFLIALTS